MSSDLKTDVPDELREALAAFRLMLKGYASAAVGGAIWHYPTTSTMFSYVTSLASGILVYVTCLALVPAAMVIRNILGRRMNLAGRTRLVIALGLIILFILIIIAVAISKLGRNLYATS
jgi:tetrahydromethanopterin S-methyltransferase subunit E